MVYLIYVIFIYCKWVSSPPPLPVAAALMYRFKIDLFYPVYVFNDTANKIYHDNR